MRGTKTLVVAVMRSSTIGSPKPGPSSKLAVSEPLVKPSFVFDQSGKKRSVRKVGGKVCVFSSD